MKVGALISNGNESIYSIDLIRRERHEVVCLIFLKSKRGDLCVLNINIVRLIAKAIDLPLVYKETSEENGLDDLEEIIKEAKKKYKIRGLVSGVVDSIYQKTKIENICEKLKLKTFSPVWHRNRLSIMEDMIKEGYQIKIISIAIEGLDKNWLGRNLDLEALKWLEELNKKNQINIFEEGEIYKSIVLGGPIFNKKIKINKVKKDMKNEYTGKYIILDAGLK
jgi:uncharacterized protein (TIGR00290 family)